MPSSKHIILEMARKREKLKANPPLSEKAERGFKMRDELAKKMKKTMTW